MRNMIAGNVAVLTLAAFAALGSSEADAATTVNVSSVAQLQNALSSANSAGGNTTILLADGTYTLTSTLNVNANGITIGSQSGVRENVIIQGDAMSANAAIGDVILIQGSNDVIRDVTLQHSGWHAIQVAGEQGAQAPLIHNVVLRDVYEQLLKVSEDLTKPTVVANNGIVENSLFIFTAGIGPQYYIGGIDAHGVSGWTVRNNTFKNIISPNTSVAEFAVHFWDASRNNTVEKNIIVNCDRGIGFGIDGRGNSGGIIRNNMIYHAAGTGTYADVAITAIDSPGTQIYNNNIYSDNAYPSAIEYRYADTTGLTVVNNLTNKAITARDGAAATASHNVTSAQAAWFVSPTGGNLHLASGVSGVMDAGMAVSGLTDDFDGQLRPQGAAIDIGADEYAAGGSTSGPTVPMPPTNVTVN